MYPKSSENCYFLNYSKFHKRDNMMLLAQFVTARVHVSGIFDFYFLNDEANDPKINTLCVCVYASMHMTVTAYDFG